MGKYQKELVKTKARKFYTCENGHKIMAGDYYYKEMCKDRFLHSIYPKKFCLKCYEKFGEKLLTMKIK